MADAHQERPRGLWFEDYRAGQVFDSAARTVTEADVVAFAGLSGDYNPIHVDEEHARRSVFRKRIAHGLLIEAIASGLAHGTGMFDGTISALAGIEIAFQKPVFFGDTIRLRLEVLEVDPDPSPKRGRVRFSTTVTKQTGEVVVEGSWSIVFLRDRSRRAPVPAAEDAR
jgi:acyl dehydratase